MTPAARIVLGFALAIQGLTTGPGAHAAEKPAVRDVSAVEQVRYHMGTLWTVEAHGPGAEAAMEAAFAEIGRLDRLLSTYKPDSELSRLNREGGKGWVSVSAETRNLVERALAFARMSDGAFDPTVGPLVQLWGFKHMDYRVPSAKAIAKRRDRVGYALVQSDARRGLRFMRPGVELDLGAIAKGYAVDRALAILAERGMTSARVDAGGNQGVYGPPPRGGAWTFGIRHPRREGDVIGWTRLSAGSVSTSGDAERGFWEHGVRYGHVIDARTGRPAAGVLSVTVLAPDAETADALSTALYVLGPERGLATLRLHPEVEALWVLAGSEPGRFTVRQSPGFPWQPAEADAVLN